MDSVSPTIYQYLEVNGLVYIFPKVIRTMWNTNTIWTRVAVSISYVGNNYNKNVSKYIHLANVSA